jgi:hypothetical protein
MAQEYAKGVCPDRRFVVLRPHNRHPPGRRRPVVCLSPGGYSRVHRIRG